MAVMSMLDNSCPVKTIIFQNISIFQNKSNLSHIEELVVNMNENMHQFRTLNALKKKKISTFSSDQSIKGNK